MLNPEDVEELTLLDACMYTYCPMDDPISVREAAFHISKLTTSKSPGLDGIPPSILKSFPDSWILVLTFPLNFMFSGTYSTSGHIQKIRKKGSRSLCTNYRGISIGLQPSILQLYYGINSCFQLLYKPAGEQAGAQASQSCAEQLLTNRLIIVWHRKLF